MFPHVDLTNNNQELMYRINCRKALISSYIKTVIFHCVDNSTNSERGQNQKIKRYKDILK